MISLSEIKRRIDAGELTPETAVSQSLNAIRTFENDVKAFASVAPCPHVSLDGPLRGVAVAVKDIIDTSDLPTEMGSLIYKGWRPRADAPIVMMLKRAGATIVGKATTCAFAGHEPTVTRNPRNLDYTPGGSSAGSAAAVGAGMVPLAVGTQTGGSTIRPASFCGVAAIKPSFGLLPTVGIKTYSWSLDTVGLFAATVEDLSFALSALTDRPEFTEHELQNPPRIGILRQEFAGFPEPEGDEALTTAAAAAERDGAAIHTITLSDIFAEAWRMHGTVSSFEMHTSLKWEYHMRHDDIEPYIREWLDETANTSPYVYEAALNVMRRARSEFAEALSGVEAVLSFSAPGPAPKGLASTGEARFNRLASLLGVPSINVPAITSETGMPIGVQVLAPFGEDSAALAVARFVERALSRRHVQCGPSR
ncbi:amidase [Bradyrhizobium sp. 183]|uniref:amidase n=1 Tax=unclassified Bradyrhizobium TaxID=2631580 RepID=UPI001FFFE751|nr:MULTISPECIES: amidase [unclassified Bradyrhizobium]UPJ79314.1 amidase [Bradyrhizobium sp. 184]UPJ87108.1 amidase [Bradyrhizobium sp. 183]